MVGAKNAAWAVIATIQLSDIQCVRAQLFKRIEQTRLVRIVFSENDGREDRIIFGGPIPVDLLICPIIH